MNEYHEDVVLN